MRKNEKEYYKGCLFVVLSTTLYGIMPTVSLLGYSHGLNSFSLFFGRSVITIVVFAVIAACKKLSLRINVKQAAYAFFLAALGIINGICAYSSYYYLPVGIASLMAMMYVFFVVIIECMMSKHKLERYKLLILCATALGMAVMLWNNEENDGISVKGIILGLVGALAYSVLINVMNNDHMKEVPLEVIFMYNMLPSVIIMPVIANLFNNQPFPVSTTQWFFCILITIMNSVLAMRFFFNAVRIIGAGNASIIGSFEPIVSCIVGLIFVNEHLSARSIIGGLIIIVSIVSLNYFEKKD